jgi:hypothetical protein
VVEAAFNESASRLVRNKSIGKAVMAFVHAAYQPAELDHHGSLYRGVFNFLYQFVGLLEIERR